MTTRSILAVVLFTALAATAAPPPGEPLLSDKRWQEHSHGLSLRPPLGSRLLEASIDDAVLRISGEGNYAIKIYLKTPTTIRMEVDAKDFDKARTQGAEGKAPAGNGGDLSLDDITQKAIEQVGFLQPSAKLIEEPRRIEGQPLATKLIYFKIPDKKRGAWVLGQAVTKLPSSAVALVQLEVDEPQFAKTRPIFEAVVRSLMVENPAELNKQRTEMLDRGEAWRQSLTSKALHAAMVPEQWLRVTEGAHDTGFIKITQAVARELDLPGIGVTVQAHLAVGEQTLDSLGVFFLSDNGENEVWSIRTTARSTKPTPAGAKAVELPTFAETGVRSKTKITVTHQGPTGTKEFNWEMPPKGYLSQVEVQMLDALLPHRAPMEIGIYAFSSAVGKIAFRTERVAPENDGTCIVYSRVSPEQPEQASVFSANGKLARRTLPNGQVLAPATRAEMAARASAK